MFEHELENVPGCFKQRKALFHDLVQTFQGRKGVLAVKSERLEFYEARGARLINYMALLVVR